MILFRRLLLAFTCLYWLGLLTLTHLPPRELPKAEVDDKLEHFLSYGLLTTLLLTYRSLRRPKPTAVPADWPVIALVLAYGALDELTQPRFGRTCDFHDWLADGAGAAAAVALFGLVRWTGQRWSARRPSMAAGTGAVGHGGTAAEPKTESTQP